MNFLTAWFNKRIEAIQQGRKERVQELKATLRRVPTGRLLMDFADARKTHIRFDPDLRGATAVMQPTNSIALAFDAPYYAQVAALAHEIRHIWQDQEGLMIRRKTQAWDNIINTRFCEADAFAVEAQVAWELTQSGIVPQAWKAYKKTCPAAMGQAYERMAETAPQATRDGRAMHAVFDAWFSTHFRDRYDDNGLADSKRQLERAATGHAASVEFDRKRRPGEAAPMSAEFLRGFGQVGEINYLAGVNTYSPLYISKPTKRLSKKFNKLAARFPQADKGAVVPKLG